VGTFGTGSYYQPVPKLLGPELSWWPTWRDLLYRFVSNRYERGGALVPNNLYRLLNRYECPSGTGTDERFSTSEPSSIASEWRKDNKVTTTNWSNFMKGK